MILLKFFNFLLYLSPKKKKKKREREREREYYPYFIEGEFQV